MTALCPGATDTDFFARADAVGSAAFQKGNVMSLQAVAEEGYDALMKGERVRIAGGMSKAMVFSSRFVPDFILAKFAETFYADVNEGEHHRKPGDITRRAAADN